MSCHHLEDILFIQPLSSSTLSMTDTCGTAGGHQCRCGPLQHVCALGESVYICVPPPMNMFFLVCVLSIWVYGRFHSPSLCASYWFSSTQPLSVKHTVSNNPALHLISVSHTRTHTRTLCPPLPRQTSSGTQPNVSLLCHLLTHTHSHTRALYARAKQCNVHTPNKAAHGHRGNQAERAAN